MSKWALSPYLEQWLVPQFPDCNIFSVQTATYIAAGVAQVSQQTLLKAYTCGSLHARDWGSTQWNEVWKDEEAGLRGGAVRLAFHVDTVTKWAEDHKAMVAASRLANAARLNAQRSVTDPSSSFPA